MIIIDFTRHFLSEATLKLCLYSDILLKECNTPELPALMNEHPDVIFYRICRSPIFIQGVHNGFALAPSKELHQSYQFGKIVWDEYVPRYKNK